MTINSKLNSFLSFVSWYEKKGRIELTDKEKTDMDKGLRRLEIERMDETTKFNNKED